MLTVYRASAGSGKTHKLTGEYLKLLYNHPLAYRRILAVTFTNKATDEMKSRIILELYNLSSDKRSNYVDDLCVTHNLTEEQTRLKARDILISILHDYSAFHISTIDRFFQQTMRAFTREIGLQGGYGIEMDQELVLTEAIDNLLGDLEKPESKDLLGWLLSFAEDKIESGGEWSLHRDMMMLSREVFKESYKASSEEVYKDIEDKNALEKYKNELFGIIRSIESEVKQLGERGLDLIRQYGLQPSDFKGGSRSQILTFEKWAAGEMKEPTDTFKGMAQDADSCCTKTTSLDVYRSICQAFDGGLGSCMQAIITLFDNLTAYYTAKEIVRHYYTLGILTDVSRQIAAYREENNVMLIADTTELLNKVIDGSDTPFIYEKTGVNVDHYMIDEFQDTSHMQWNNFRPLIGESLAYRRKNLIVGDVKQSIYRFRNSDWKLLDEQVQRDFSPEQVGEETLKENWRSCWSIVEFNNSLFTEAPLLLQHLYNQTLSSSSLNEKEQEAFATKIISAYADCKQQIAPPFVDNCGHVRVEFLSGDEDDKSWKEEAMEKLPGVLEQLQDNGYELKDIAILVRTNKEGAQVAETLLSYKEAHPSDRYKYDLISDDALFINSSTSVRFIISLLQYLKNPADHTLEEMTCFSYLVLKGDFDPAQRRMPGDLKEKLLSLSRQSLYEMTEGICRLFADVFPDNEQVFLQAFLDLVTEYGKKESGDLGRFLRWWDETGSRKTIATPDSQNAIRILTVHKSKGLGFKAVIVPFCDWEIDHKPTKPVILWCRPEEQPFNKLHLVPVRYGQILSKTIFSKDYYEEKLYAFIDNLNTLYVAFTRAKEELIVYAPRPKKAKENTGDLEKITSIGDLLWSGINTGEDVYEKGEWWQTSSSLKDDEMKEERVEKLMSVSPDDRLQLRLYGKGFFFDNPLRKRGALMHEVLSRIRTKEDISSAVESYYLSGMIDESDRQSITERLNELLDKPVVAGWYDNSSRILNEVEILLDKGVSRRPDRVMIKNGEATVIDYKFGEQQDKKHHNQVKNYMRLIAQMGYQQVKGYLWYVELDQVEPVII